MDQATPGFLTCASGSSSAARPDAGLLLAAGLGAAWELVEIGCKPHSAIRPG